MTFISNYLFLFYMLFISNIDEAYLKAEKLANSTTTLQHEYTDSFYICGNQIKSVIYKDTIINKPGCIGTEYNYPIYKFETEITYYNDEKIAAIETKQIELKRYQYLGVTTGIQIIAKLDSTNTFYFDQNQKLINHKQLLQIQEKICRENKDKNKK